MMLTHATSLFGLLHSIEVCERGEEGVLVELAPELDRHALKDLKETLSDVVALRLPVVLDLSGVDFLDVEATRELTIYSYLYAHHLTLSNPSWQVRASVAACGLGTWLNFRYEAGDTTCPGLLEKLLTLSDQREARTGFGLPAVLQEFSEPPAVGRDSGMGESRAYQRPKCGKIPGRA